MKLTTIKQSFAQSSPVVQWGSLIIIIIIAWSLLLSPLFAWKENQQSALQQKIKKTAKILALKENASAWTQAKKALSNANKQAKNSYYHTATANQAQAKFQLLLEQTVKKSNLQLKNQRVTPPVRQPSVGDKLPVWLHLETTELSNIIKFLDELANQEKIIIVEKFNIANLGRTKLLQLSVAAFRYQKPAQPGQDEIESN